jgi:hypothetical protein
MTPVQGVLSSIAHVRLRLGIALGGIALLAACAPAASATTYTVSGGADGTGACPGAVCPTLRAAVSAANANPGPDQIDLQPGTYGIELGSGTPEDLNATGDLDVRDDLTIKGAGAGASTILGALPSGQGESDINVPGNANLTLAGVTVSGGRAGENYVSSLGGGVYAAGTGTLALEGVVVSDNVAAGGKASFADGGGIAKQGGRLVVRNSTLMANRAEAPGYGGAIYIEGAATSAELTNVTIAGNTAYWEGGGLESSAQGPVDLAFVTITGNQAEHQGGGIGEAGGVHIRDTIVDGNSAPLLPEHSKPEGLNCQEAPVSEGGNVADPACGLSQVSDAPVFDPLLAPLGGAPVPVLEPLAGSPALDRAVGACPAQDARGVARPQGGACDSGAAERPVAAGASTPPATLPVLVRSGGPPPRLAAQLRSSLLAQLLPKRRVRISALLKRPLALPFQALAAGSLRIVWYYVPHGAHLARAKAKPRPVPIAAAGAAFSKAGSYTLRLRLTIRGRRILRHAKRLAVTARGVFTPSGAGALVARRSFTLRR